ncbi:MAG: monofunctional biosynthetic peptidoglycan transglycosylase [Betaproteobacteria bacterium]|jgi:monofunctional glycosyltransferase|nr:monofunctional biosynthetic peptidoglycan transglycosylase [Betaproteobacteria bacterium]NBT09386.1 monofunctional biosynthetic peptidoglycan transglycosylase [Betaproteobacteria bacterium]NBU49422.1 monofunctional biosynthetic peptidoglycan transglycosylase [Betaproteobacteria bacterium]NBX96640.1 monofunctional biosynthetic peptidoglycan transglycosylase [Betaproteobacteria bacterium]
MTALRQLGRLLVLLMVGVVALQLYFLMRTALMAVVNPTSTTFQRTQALRILQRDGRLAWNQSWVDLRDMGTALPRAALASEDAGFVDHQGLDWEAIQKARERNERRRTSAAARPGTEPPTPKPERLMGGSTITQQLAKNLFLSGERTYWRKGQEALITWALEASLSKARILEIYLNSVEWGEGVYGARAAAEHYFRVEPHQLQALQAARLAVMLPAPRRFEQLPNSPYLATRAETIAARMPAVALPQGMRP